MSDPGDLLERLRLDYRAALIGYLSRRGERQLTSAYEIGRNAIPAGVGLLPLVEVHNSVALQLLREAPDGPERIELAEATGTFLLEVLAAWEMTQRGFLEKARDPDA